MRQTANPPNSIHFVHIPKTAGTTLLTIIENQYAPAERYFLDLAAQRSLDRFIAMPETERYKIRMLAGHAAFGLHKYLAPPTAHFTILREPIDRILSFYYFVRHNQKHYLYDFSRSSRLTLTDFVNSGVTIMVDNFQTRLISGMGDTHPFGELPDEALELAKTNLNHHFDVVGLTEAFDETLLLLSQAYGWQNIYYTRQNVTSNRPHKASIPAETRAVIAHANQMDMALYAYACELFARQVQRYGDAFTTELRQFRLKNRFLLPLISFYNTARQYSVRIYVRRQIERLTR